MGRYLFTLPKALIHHILEYVDCIETIVSVHTVSKRLLNYSSCYGGWSKFSEATHQAMWKHFLKSSPPLPYVDYRYFLMTFPEMLGPEPTLHIQYCQKVFPLLRFIEWYRETYFALENTSRSIIALKSSNSLCIEFEYIQYLSLSTFRCMIVIIIMLCSIRFSDWYLYILLCVLLVHIYCLLSWGQILRTFVANEIEVAQFASLQERKKSLANKIERYSSHQTLSQMLFKCTHIYRQHYLY